MATRRTAATGFGGASPGVSILSGVARGQTQRREEQREIKRRAILNRLSRAQLDRTQQAMRHAEEDQQFEQEQRERALEASRAAVESMKPTLQEMGVDPSVGEDLGVDFVKNVLDIEQARANLEQTETSTQSNRLSQQGTRLTNQLSRAKLDALGLAADPTALRIGLNDGIDDETRMRALQTHLEQSGADVDDEALGLFVQNMNEARKRLRNQERGLTDAEVAQLADETINAVGSPADALERVRTNLEEMPEGPQKSRLRLVAEEIERRQRTDEGRSRDRDLGALEAALEEEGIGADTTGN